MCQPRQSNQSGHAGPGGHVPERSPLEHTHHAVAERLPLRPISFPVQTQQRSSERYYRRRAARRRYFRGRRPAGDFLQDVFRKQGKPGSRRHRRYQNRIFAHCNLPTQEEEEEVEPVVWHSHFQLVGSRFFHPAEDAQNLEPEGDCEDEPEEKTSCDDDRDEGRELGSHTNEIMYSVCESWLIAHEGSSVDVDDESTTLLLDMLVRSAETTPARDMYRRIVKPDRRFLRQLHGSRLLRELEFVLVFFQYNSGRDSGCESNAVSNIYRTCISKLSALSVVESNQDTLTLYLSSSFQRRAAHALSRYYQIRSCSREDDEGQRVTCFEKRICRTGCKPADGASLSSRGKYSTTLSTHVQRMRL